MLRVFFSLVRLFEADPESFSGGTTGRVVANAHIIESESISSAIDEAGADMMSVTTNEKLACETGTKQEE